MDDKKVITRFGKSIVIKRCKDCTLFRIEVEGGGTQPPEFAGRWRYQQAVAQIQGYIAAGKGKETAREDKPRADQTIDFQRLGWEKEEADNSPVVKQRVGSAQGRRHDRKYQAEA